MCSVLVLPLWRKAHGDPPCIAICSNMTPGISKTSTGRTHPLMQLLAGAYQTYHINLIHFTTTTDRSHPLYHISWFPRCGVPTPLAEHAHDNGAPLARRRVRAARTRKASLAQGIQYLMLHCGRSFGIRAPPATEGRPPAVLHQQIRRPPCGVTRRGR